MTKITVIEAYKAARTQREQRMHAAKFARAITRSVFRDDYVDDAQLAEVRRSLARQTAPRISRSNRPR